MVAQLGSQMVAACRLVQDPMLFREAPRPGAQQRMPQWRWPLDAFHRMPSGGNDEFADAAGDSRLRMLTVQVVLPEYSQQTRASWVLPWFAPFRSPANASPLAGAAHGTYSDEGARSPKSPHLRPTTSWLLIGPGCE